MSTEKRPSFQLGLVMAGAVSAGAYSAGAIDFLFEALAAWYKAKEDMEEVPAHDVCIRAMTGASAGGMTAAIAASYLYQKGINDGVKSLLRKTWVNDIDITRLLQSQDLERENVPFQSLLDSTAIDDIANSLLDPQKLSKSGTSYQPLPYIHERLKLYLTLSNLRGLPYSFNVEGADDFHYAMSSHADYQYAEISKSSSVDDWANIREAAVATGAFPVGLAARLIQRDTQTYIDRKNADGRDFSKFLKLKKGYNSSYDFISVDGGMLNNEPLELARVALKEDRSLAELNQTLTSNTDKTSLLKQAADKTNSAIVMIDPFPNLREDDDNAEFGDTALKRIVAPLISALRNQSLFKPEELMLTASKHVYNRYMIAPVRYQNGTKAAHPIACGFLGGFGGFLSESFRNHDYILGRRNCQLFLKEHFAVPLEEFKEHPIFKGTIKEEFIFNKDGKQHYPIIPLIGSLKQEEGKTNPWPVYEKKKYESFKKGVRSRIKVVLQGLFPWIKMAKTICFILPGLGLAGYVGSFFISPCCPADEFIKEGLKITGMLLIILPLLFLVLEGCLKKKIQKSILKTIKKLLQSYSIHIK